MATKRAFTFIELLTIMSLVALLIVILVPSFAARRISNRRMPNNTRLRGIHQGAIQYAQGNSQKYPGLGADYDAPPFGLAQADVFHGTARMLILWQNNYFTADFMISPLESLAEASTTISTSNYSYSPLKLTNPGNNPTGDAKARNDEWAATSNSEAPVITDRSIVDDPTMNTTSVHVTTTTSASSAWRGGVVWNDNHVTFETSGICARTRYGDGDPVTDDDLFDASNNDGRMEFRGGPHDVP